MESNSQQNLKTNRAPRVQIEYDVEVNGQTKQVELPFVMGVLSDLSGDNKLLLNFQTELGHFELEVSTLDTLNPLSTKLYENLCS